MPLKPIKIRWIRTGSVSDTGKLFLASYYTQFFTNNEIKINDSFVSNGLRLKKTGFNPVIFSFNIRGKLFIIAILSNKDKNLIFMKAKL